MEPVSSLQLNIGGKAALAGRRPRAAMQVGECRGTAVRDERRSVKRAMRAGVINGLFAELFVVLTPLTVAAEAAADGFDRGSIGIEFGPVWFSRNDVRIPGDTGTEFDMTELTGSGPDPFVRINGDWNFNKRHGLRVVLAPLEVSGTGTLEQDTDFAGTTFPAGPTEGTYKFNTYKLTYRYTFYDGASWRWRVGFTGLIRDAEIKLQQPGLSEQDTDTGFVPLLHLYGEWAFAERWGLVFDFDGLAGGPGRAIDAAIKVTFDVDDHWRIGGGYRTIEGGADTDSVYNFAWLHYAVLSAAWRF